MPEKEVKKIKVKLLAPHNHKGEPCKKGDTIEVNPEKKAWLAKRNIIEGEG